MLSKRGAATRHVEHSFVEHSHETVVATTTLESRYARAAVFELMRKHLKDDLLNEQFCTDLTRPPRLYVSIGPFSAIPGRCLMHRRLTRRNKSRWRSLQRPILDLRGLRLTHRARARGYRRLSTRGD